jgi:PAS domain S-box-containing protein
MTNWIREHIKSRLFRKLFLPTLAAALIPILVIGVFWIKNRHGLTEDLLARLLPQYYGVIIFTLLLAGLVAFYLSRYITTPISALTKSAIEIARGNFSHEIQVKSDDEIGRLARLFNYMTTELRRLHSMNLAQIIAERNKTQTIIKNIADGAVVTDPKSRVLILNAVAEKWFGLQESEAFEKPLSDYIKEPRLLQLISEATSNKTSVLPAVEINLKVSGEWKPRTLQARAARVLQENGELIGIVTILRDVTQQKEIDKMKTELVSMVAHELRSPLTSISGFSELLLDSDITPEQSSEYANIILKEANRLSDLINKFLDISRIESGRIQPKKVRMDLGETVQMVVGNNSYLASRKGIEVDIHRPDRLDEVIADSGMMEQVFLNLFSNAIKYSADKTRIDFVLRQTEDEIIVEVHDQGYGIPPKALSKIFDKFYRVTENEKVRETTGSGLGLSLVKQIVEMHGGRIEVESELGHGSVFSVFLARMNGRQKANMQQGKDAEDIVW